MPVVGNQSSDVVSSRSFHKGSEYEFANAIVEMAENIASETQTDFFTESARLMRNKDAARALKNFFVNESADAEEFADNPAGLRDHEMMMEQLFENDRQGILEYASIGSYNPVMGLVLPLHKNMMMNNVFDKGVIPKAVAKTPKFTLSMEVRKMIGVDGTEIDMFTEQNRIFELMESSAPTRRVFVEVNPTKPIIPGGADEKAMRESLNLALYGAKDGFNKAYDAYSITTAITGIVIDGTNAKDGDAIVVDSKAVNAAGETYKTVGVKTASNTGDLVVAISPRRFEPGYGELDRQITTKFNFVKPGTTDVVEGYITGYTKNNQFMISCVGSADIKGVIIDSKRDTSNAMVDTPSVRWDAVTQIVEIPNANPINVPISPEEVKDVQALYNVDQLSKTLGLIKDVLGNYKDDKIRKELDLSFKTMPAANKLAATFDFCPPDTYNMDPVNWRRTMFMDQLDMYVTTLLQVLNDPNVTVSVIGAPALIRRITPVEYTYQSPSSIGPVELDYKRTVVTSDKRVYNFVSSDKLRNDSNLIIVLNPRNTDRVIYTIYDYQLYLSNEIRNKQNYALPAVHAFERFHFFSYQPVQGRLRILNASGLRDTVQNTKPVTKDYNERYDMNDHGFYDSIRHDGTKVVSPTGYPYPVKYDLASNPHTYSVEAELTPAAQAAKAELDAMRAAGVTSKVEPFELDRVVRETEK